MAQEFSLTPLQSTHKFVQVSSSLVQLTLAPLHLRHYRNSESIQAVVMSSQ